MGPGYRFRTDQDIRSCVNTVATVLQTHVPTKYEHMPTLYPSVVRWHGERPSPTEASSCSFGEQHLVLFTFWSTTGTEIGVFPLNARSGVVDDPVIRDWHKSDSTVSLIDEFGGGQVTLLPPQVDPLFLEDILRVAGRPITTKHVEAVAAQLTKMFLVKGYEYIAGIDHDEQRASRFVDDHLWNGDIMRPQQVLDDLAEWNYGVVPYLQSLPWTVRAILLEPGPDGQLTGDLWRQI